MSAYSNLSSPLAYIDDSGLTHYLTVDGLPPANGYPPPPGYELRLFSFPIPPCSPPAPNTASPATLTAAPCVPTPQPQPVACYTFQPVQQATVVPPAEFVYINFICNGVRPHRDRYTGRNRDEEIIYTVCCAITSMKMKDLIKAFEGGGARGFTECKLLSDGRSWAEVKTFKLSDDSSEKTLAEVGWTESRGVDGPLWVCAYHEGLEEEEEKSYWEELGFPTS